MKKSCRYCGGVHALNVECPQKPAKAWKSKYSRETCAAKFRSTNAWTEKAQAIKKRDRYLCRVCLARGKINSKGLSVHHIIPLRDNYDRRLEDDNLITLCEQHHSMAERGRISKEELFELVNSTVHIPPGGEPSVAGKRQDRGGSQTHTKFPK